jgi:putative oxidoreductase
MIHRPAPLPTRVAARWLLAPIFVISGSEVFAEPSARAAKADALGIPNPELATRANAAFMAVAGVALGLGIAPRLVATGLIVSLIPTTVAGHAFWEEQNPKTAAAQRVQFLKNLGLMGGLLLVATERR